MNMWETYILGRIDEIRIFIEGTAGAFLVLAVFSGFAVAVSEGHYISIIITVSFALSGFFGFMLYAFLPSRKEIEKLQNVD